ncbi:hypothetical protein ACTJIL_11380 [Luteimonas sp. 22616]|jgi:hypothetical protein|uniref:hypothetical protein n=1 Tax=Luteimonas sp. 22616 TaxID=3453951 RepID=UPI003F86522F
MAMDNGNRHQRRHALPARFDVLRFATQGCNDRDCRYAGTGVPQNTTVRPPIEKDVEKRLHCIHCARNVRAHSPIPAHEHHDVPSMNLFPHIAITPRTPRDYRVADLCALPVANARLEGFPILD